MKILNLYAGVGGNRRLWQGHDITAVELDPKIAAVYKDLYPEDEVIIGDAHEYLLQHYKEFDFIWSSPPCVTHSRLRFTQKTQKYPDMSLYQEIILLKTFFKGDWVVENVKPYYRPLIEPSFTIDRHVYWCNKTIKPYTAKEETYTDIRDISKQMEEAYNINLDKYVRTIRIRQALRNMVKPEHGLYILNEVTHE